ncbi:MAG: ammonia channel protein, partial [Verrucomicrobiota bacterium]
MKRLFLTLALIATTAFGVFTSRADDTNAAATAAAPAPAAAPASLPPASIDQRVAALEAYIANTDPMAPLKGTNGTQNTANTPVIGNPGPGHNAWLLTSTALVLFMTLPGLALFYGGMVRRKNVLSVLAQCFLITGLVTILWVFVGYGMIFGGTGDMTKDWIKGWVGSPMVNWMLNGVTSA